MALTDAQSGALILDGSIPMEITLAGTAVKGDAMGYASGWKRALATTGTAIQAKCVAGTDGKTGDKIVAYFGKTRIGGRFTSNTIGNPVYAAEGSANGQWTESAPATTGDCNKVCGYIISASEIVVDCLANIDSVA